MKKSNFISNIPQNIVMYRFFLMKGLFLCFLMLLFDGLTQTPVCPKTTSNVDIINGTFEAGNDGSFSSGFTYSTSTTSLSADNYTIASNPNPLNSGYFKNMYDHTKGDASGKMLVIDFNDNSKGDPVVTFTNISVAANRLYFFSAWFANIGINNTTACATCPAPYTQKITNSPILKFEILSGGTVIKSQTIYVDSLTNNWNQYNTPFSQATSGTVDIRIVNIRGGNASNDLALDDISFKSSCSGVADLSKLGKSSGLSKTVYTCNENFPYALDTKLTNSKYAFSWYQNNSQVVDGILTDDMKKAASTSTYSVTAAPANNTKYYVCYDSLQDGISCPRLDSVIFLSNFKFDIPNQTVCPPVSVVLDPAMSTTNISSWKYERISPTPIATVSSGTGLVLPLSVSDAGTYRLTIVHNNGSCTASPDNIVIDTLVAAFNGAINASCSGGTATGTVDLVPNIAGTSKVTIIGGLANVSWFKTPTGNSPEYGPFKSADGKGTTSASNLVTTNPACPQGGLYLQDNNSYPTSVPLANCAGAMNELNGVNAVFEKITLTAPASISSLTVYTKANNGNGEDLTVVVDLFPSPIADFNTPGTGTVIAKRDIVSFSSTSLAPVSVPGNGTVIQPGTYYVRVRSYETATPGNVRAVGVQASCRGVASNYVDNKTPSVISFDNEFREYGNIKTGVHGAIFDAQFSVGNPSSCGRVWVCATCTLPVEYTYFNVYPTGGQDVLITWGTAHESKNRVFVVEASSDGVNFTAVAEVGGSHNSHLQKDYSVQQSMIGERQYYRIKQVDHDGKFTYTPVKFVSLNGSDAIGEVYPQPVKHGEVLHVNINGLTDTQLTLKLQSISGFDISEQTVAIGENTEAITFNTAGLTAGVYLLLINNTDFAKTIRVVVE